MLCWILDSWKPQDDDGNTWCSGETFHLMISEAVAKLSDTGEVQGPEELSELCLSGSHGLRRSSMGQAFSISHLCAFIH